MSEYPLAALGRASHTAPLSILERGGPQVGDGPIAVIAGPCSVEGREMLLQTAHAVRDSGAVMLRGGAYKPRSSPYSFRGLGEAALEILVEAREATGLPIVTELVDVRHLEQVVGAADVLQVGARNMQNFALLAALGESGKPVLLKRGMSATIKELLLAAEHVMAHGNSSVILCERGIRTFETATRNTLDVSAVPVLKLETHLPVIVDPSHAAGRADIVIPLAAAAVAAGADGLIVEVHPSPESALSDGFQSLTPEAFDRLMRIVAPVAAAVGRTVAAPPSSAVAPLARKERERERETRSAVSAGQQEGDGTDTWRHTLTARVG